MARQKTEAIVKVKNAILELSDDDAEATAEWLDMLLEVRQQERERAAKKAEGKA
jgi:hypothetical protein